MRWKRLAGAGLLGATLIGQDAEGVERHWQAMYHAWRWRGGAIQSTAQSALDIALWDLEGKRLGVPVYRLLGGPYTDRIRSEELAKVSSGRLQTCETLVAPITAIHQRSRRESPASCKVVAHQLSPSEFRQNAFRHG